MHACMWVCVHECMYVCRYSRVCMHVCVCEYVLCMHACMGGYMCASLCMHVCMYACMYVCVCMYVCACECVYEDAYICLGDYSPVTVFAVLYVTYVHVSNNVERFEYWVVVLLVLVHPRVPDSWNRNSLKT